MTTAHHQNAHNHRIDPHTCFCQVIEYDTVHWSVDLTWLAGAYKDVHSAANQDSVASANLTSAVRSAVVCHASHWLQHMVTPPSRCTHLNDRQSCRMPHKDKGKTPSPCQQQVAKPLRGRTPPTKHASQLSTQSCRQTAQPQHSCCPHQHASTLLL